MNKGWILLGVILGVFLLSPSASAVGGVTEYTIEEAEMTLEIPGDLYVLERDFDIDDPYLAAFGVDGQEMKDYFNDSDIYLDAFQLTVGYEIIVHMKEEGINPDADLSTETDEALTAMADEMAQWGALLMSAVYEESTYYRNARTTFLKFKFLLAEDDKDIYCIQYHTFYHGKSIKITLRIYDADSITNPEAYMKQVADSISFEGAESAPSVTDTPAPAHPDELVYSDEEAGVTFTVPDGWHPKELSEDREYIKVKYTDDDKSFIMFGYYDFWEAIPAAEQLGITRSACDNSIVTTADIRDMHETSGKTVLSVDRETLSGVEYYRVHSTLRILGMDVDSFTHIMIHDGILYEFDAMFYDETDAYDDYKDLLKSVRYSFATARPDSDLSASSDDAGDLPYDWLIGSLLLSLLYTVTLYSVPILIYRFLIVKKPLPAAKARKIAIIYGIVALLIAVAVGSALGDSSPGGAVIVWSFINYFILKSGRPRQEESDNPLIQGELSQTGRPDMGSPSAPQSRPYLTCPRCKTVMPPDSAYCSHCGSRII